MGVIVNPFYKAGLQVIPVPQVIPPATLINTVANFSALPDPTTVSGEFYWCLNPDGDNLTGLYYSDGTSWSASEAVAQTTVVANYSALPDPTTVPDKFYWVSNSQGTAWLPGSLGGTYYNSGLYYSNGVTWEFLNTPIQVTQSEVDAAVIGDKFVSPVTLKSNTNKRLSFTTISTTGQYSAGYYNLDASGSSFDVTLESTAAIGSSWVFTDPNQTIGANMVSIVNSGASSSEYSTPGIYPLTLSIS